MDKKTTDAPGSSAMTLPGIQQRASESPPQNAAAQILPSLNGARAEETDAALPATAAKSLAVGSAGERDEALPVTPQATYALSAEAGSYVLTGHPVGLTVTRSAAFQAGGQLDPVTLVAMGTVKDPPLSAVEDPIISFPAEWKRRLPDFDARLKRIEVGMTELRSMLVSLATPTHDRFGPGGNNPPTGLLISELDATAEEAITAARVFRSEIRSATPRADVIRLAWFALKRALGIIGRWLARKADRLVDKMIDTAGPLITATLAAKLAGIELDLAAIVASVENLFLH